MRDLIVIAIVIGSIPFIVVRPHVGILVWTWLAYMNPHRLTWGFAYDFPFSLIVAAATLFGLVTTSEPRRFPWNRTTIVLTIWVAWMTLTSYFAVLPDAAWTEWQRMIKIQLMNAVALMFMGTKHRLNAFVWTIVISLGFYGIRGGIFTVLTGGRYLVWGPPDSFFEGNTGLGLSLLMMLPLMYYVRLQAKKGWHKWALTAWLLVTGVAILGTYSRGAFLGGAAVAIFLWLKSPKKLVPALAIVVFLPIAVTFMPDQWMARMETIETYEEDASAMGRVNAWWFSYNIAKERPVVGGGFNVFTPELFRIYAPDPDDFHDAHSIYFEVLGEHGFIGLGVFLTLFALAWRTGSWTIRHSKHRPELNWASNLSRMLQVSLIGYATSGAFLGLAYFDLYYNLITLLILTKVLVQKELSNTEAVEGKGPSAALFLPGPQRDNSAAGISGADTTHHPPPGFRRDSDSRVRE